MMKIKTEYTEGNRMGNRHTATTREPEGTD